MNNVKQSSCKHNPSTKKTFWGRFVDFLFHSKNLYFSKDNTAKCAACGALLSVPKAFFHPLLKVSYFIVSSGLSYTVFSIFMNSRMSNHPALIITCSTLGMIVGWYVYMKIVNAFIFSLGLWQVEVEGDELIEERWKNASIHRQAKMFMISMGMLFVNMEYMQGQFGVHVGIFAIASLGAAIIRKKVYAIIRETFCLAYAVILLLSAHLWQIEIPFVLARFIPFVLLCAAMYDLYALDALRVGKK